MATAAPQSRLSPFLTAPSVAVIGASTHKHKVGYQVLQNLLLNSRRAPVSSPAAKRRIYPVHPTASHILGLPAVPSITALTEPVQLVIIVTPVGTVLEIVEAVIDRNKNFKSSQRVQAVLIISAGFAETDRAGRTLQELVQLKLELAGIQLLGPNSLGLVYPSGFLNASFAQADIPAGSLGIISQSGAMLTALFQALGAQNAGVSFAVSLGNKAGITENDCLEYALNDPHTSAVIMYLESFAHLPRFFELVTQLRAEKPVILLKGGTSARGQRASSSHTAALATNQTLLRAAASQFGFILAENLEELLSAAFFLAKHRQLPANTMVITNAGGPAVTTVDALTAARVPLAQWSSRARADLERLLPPLKISNPLDLLGDADPARLQTAIQVAQRDPEVESLLVILTPQAVTDLPAITALLAASQGKKPILVTIMGGEELEGYRRQLRQAGLFCVDYPNELVELLAILTQAERYRYLSGRYRPSLIHTPIESWQPAPLPRRHQQLAQQQGLRPEAVSQPNLTETLNLLRQQGFQVPPFWVIDETQQAELSQLPYPLYAKTANLSVVHKKAVGAIYGVVHNTSEAAAAYQQLARFGNQVLFQTVLKIDHELLVGIENDPQFGLYLTVGLGGSYTNLLADRAYCFLPATPGQLTKCWQNTKAAAVITAAPLSQDVVSHLVKLQQLVMRQPWIRSIEMNPLAICQDQLWVADIKLQV